jgi:hypothetical protein
MIFLKDMVFILNSCVVILILVLFALTNRSNHLYLKQCFSKNYIKLYSA